MGRFVWYELLTTDPAGAQDFYPAVTGWGTHQSAWSFYSGLFGWRRVNSHVDVADLDGALEAVRQNGGQVLNGPMDVPGGDRVAQCMDPQGAMFALHARGG